MSTKSSRTLSPGTSYAETIGDVTLPDSVLEFVEVYETVGGDRDRFVWKWIYRLLPSFTLSSVPQRHVETVRSQKTLFTLFITLLDDIAEKNADTPTFEHIRRSVLWPDADMEECPGSDARVVEFANRLWSAIDASLSQAPRYDEFADVFRYDLRQSFNAMDYTRIVNNRLSMANLNGARHYDSHNMVMFPYADMDIMYSPAFEPTDLGALRELTWDLQRMARIGNWLTTWEREVDEGDYTAGIIVYALQHGVVTLDELEQSGPEDKAAVTERIRNCGVETQFRAQWNYLRRKVRNRSLEAESVDLDAFVHGIETVMDHHLASEGYK